MSNTPRAEAAHRAIREVLGDPCRTVEQSLADLIELREVVESLIATLQDDINAASMKDRAE